MRQSMMLMMLAFFASGCVTNKVIVHVPPGSVHSTAPPPSDNDDDGWYTMQQGVAPAAPLPMDLWSPPAQPVYPADTPTQVECPKNKERHEMTMPEWRACVDLEQDYLFSVTD